MAAEHEAIGRKLEELSASQYVDAEAAARRAKDDRRRRELPFLALDPYLLLGPVVDTAACAGVAASHRPECARDWGDVLGGEPPPSNEIAPWAPK
jgi:hypothetical protein